MNTNINSLPAFDSFDAIFFFVYIINIVQQKTNTRKPFVNTGETRYLCSLSGMHSLFVLYVFFVVTEFCDLCRDNLENNESLKTRLNCQRNPCLGMTQKFLNLHDEFLFIILHKVSRSINKKIFNRTRLDSR